MRLTDEHIDALRTDGYVLVEDFLAPEELERTRKHLHTVVPTWEDFDADRDSYPDITGSERGLIVEFPSFQVEIHRNVTDPEIISFVRRLLGTEEVRLNQSLLWNKYAGTGGQDQNLHWDIDYSILGYPSNEGVYRTVPMILYYSDVTEDTAPTYVCPASHYTDEVFWPCNRPKEQEPGWYEHERPVVAPAGSLLIYSMCTMHRGSAFKASEGARFTHHCMYRSAAAEFSGWRAWPQFSSAPEMVRFIQSASPDERTLFGFPRPGDPYWAPRTLEGVAARYPGIDLDPYRGGSL